MRSARRHLAILGGLSHVLLLLLLAWVYLPGRKSYGSRRWTAMRRWGIYLATAGMVAYFIISLWHGAAYREHHSLPLESAFAWALQWPWVSILVLTAACVLLWIRHERAFRYVEMGSPLYNLNLRR